MLRFAPALLVCLLACTSQAAADDAFPSLDQRLGKTITVVEKNYPTEKAVITQVWRMEDGSPVMQAKTQTSNIEMTLVENTNAKAAAERIKIYRWVNGVRPANCPVAPQVVTQVKASEKAVTTNVATTKTVTTDKVAATDGGLVPVLPKKTDVKAVTTVSNDVPVVNVPVNPKTTVPAPVVVQQAPSVPVSVPVKQITPTAVINTTVVTQPAPVPQAAPAPAAAQKVTTTTTNGRELVGCCEVITVTENGVARKYKILGTSRDRHGVMTHRCQALDNNEIVTLNCDNCGTACAAPAKVECAPAKVACTPAPVACVPAPVKCEPAKTVCPPVVAKVEVKPCEPAKVACEPAKVACEPAKPCVTGTKACDPCANAKSICDSSLCGKCGQTAGSCDACSGKDCTDCDTAHGHRVRGHRVRGGYDCEINVPVPGVRLSTVNGVPGGPPPQPCVPAFCTMNSSSVRAYYCAPQIVPFYCLNQPFGDCLNAQISAGIHTMNPGNGEAVANTMHLINVLSQSGEWENRQWAATRLQQATLPTVRPYVEDALVAAAQHDRAPMVKVAAIRTLASMKSTRQDVLAMLAQATGDMDPRIKEAASEAMSSIMKANGVQQAGYSR